MIPINKYVAECSNCGQLLFSTRCGNIIDWVHEGGKAKCHEVTTQDVK